MDIDTITGQFFLMLRTPARTAFFSIVTMLGNPQTVVILFVIVAGWLLYKKQKKALLAFVLGLGISETVTYFAKIIFHRARPLHALIVETDYSFPSGHATVAMAFYGFIAFLLLCYYKKPFSRTFIISFATIVILLIGISRLYLGVHYLTDIVAGYAVGTLGLMISVVFYKRLNKKRE